MTTELLRAAQRLSRLMRGRAARQPRWAEYTWCSVVGVALFLAMLSLSCSATVHNRTGDTIDVSSYPPDIQAAYKVFAVRCSRCHTLARPLNARIDNPQHWVRYVARMRLNPGSGINAKNGDVILRFLLYYMRERGLQKDDDESDFPQDTTPESSDGTVPLGEPQPSAADSEVGSARTASGVAQDMDDGNSGELDEERMPKRQPSALEAEP